MIGDFDKIFRVKLMQLKVMQCCQSLFIQDPDPSCSAFPGPDPYQAADPTPKLGKHKYYPERDGAKDNAFLWKKHQISDKFDLLNARIKLPNIHRLLLNDPTKLRKRFRI
jgi:hypothetical protein